MNAILGDTETSKAIATIIVLIRHEVNTPGAGIERIGFGDAIAGSLGFVLLQRWGWERTEKTLLATGAVDTVWDVVILDQGDALLDQSTHCIEDISTQLRPHGKASQPFYQSPFTSIAGECDWADSSPVDDGASVVSSVSSQRHSLDFDASVPEQVFKSQLSKQLRLGSSVRIATQSVLKNTVAIEVQGQGECNVEPPAGYTLTAVQSSNGGKTSKHKFIFQSTKRRMRRGSFDVDTPEAEEEAGNAAISSPTTPLDSPGQSLSILATARASECGLSNVHTSKASASLLSKAQQYTPVKANEKRPRSPVSRRLEQDDPRDDYFGDQVNPNLITATPAAAEDASTKLPKRTAPNMNLHRGASYGKLVEFWNMNGNFHNRKSILESRRPIPSTVDRGPLWMSSSTTPQSPSTVAASWPSGPLTSRQSFECRQNPETDPQPDIHGFSQRRTAHRRTPSSVFSLKTNPSETSLVLRAEDQRASRDKVAQSLERTNTLPGQYPIGSFTSNVVRFARFSVAAYGSNFIRFTGAATESRKVVKDEASPLDRHQSFTSYARLPDSTILLSSYVDPEGGAHMEGHEDAGLPLIHYISLDHESKAVVLTCRGTLGFEDVLIDMTCDYDSFLWRGKAFQVHKGMLASARRLITLHGSRLIATIKAALEEFDDYGLVLCGHSLGGGVCSILGMMMSQPNPDFQPDSPYCSAFITAQPLNGPALVTGGSSYASCPTHPADALAHTLPMNRPVHVYAYGPAAAVSPALSQATNGLVTTIINNGDVVPYLSLGNIRDFQSIALAFKHDSRDAKGEMRRRVWESLRKSVRDKTGLGNIESFFARDWSGQNQSPVSDDEWPWTALESLRAGLKAPKLLPPGECFIVERKAVLQRFAFVEGSNVNTNGSRATTTQQAKSFKPASHIRVTHVKDVARRFAELRFQSSMFLDHMPSRYERILETLENGVA